MNLYNPQQNQLKTIKLLLEQLLHQTSLLEQQDQPLRRLDLDVMLKRTHKLYETLCDIPVGYERIELQEERQARPITSVAPEVKKTATIEPKREENRVEQVFDKTPEVRSDDPEPERLPEPAPVEPKPERVPEPIPEPEPRAEQPPMPPPQKPLAETHTVAEPKKEAEKPVKPRNSVTPLDLFAEEAAPSIGDHLQQQTDKSVGERIGRQPIEEIRTAIGINDKFLFINELFSGSLENYNKMLDELNEFKSFNGASTYLIELKVVNQWDGNSAAWRKLVGLIERKFDVNPEDHAL
ncbi:MAG: hypothetical protein K8F24_03490 [Bacteroidales bacterium]|nr:hypothetical protein [Bacteroidales bacterium]